MKYLVRTRDSSYVFDNEAHTWERTPNSGVAKIRTSGGSYTGKLEFEIGRRFSFFSSPAPDTPQYANRLIVTTPIVAFDTEL